MAPIAYSCIGESLSVLLPTNNLFLKSFRESWARDHLQQPQNLWLLQACFFFSFSSFQEATKQLSEKLELLEKEMCDLKRAKLEKDDELDTRAEEVTTLRRELAERDELIRQLLATSKVCGACGAKFTREMQQMESR